MDYFELFDLPVSLKVNKAEILKKYYVLSRKYHPDNFSLQDENEQQNALAMSAKINEAKKILDDSYLRLAYILKKEGITEPDEKYQLSPVFLGEMMDINEQLMEMDPENADENLKQQIRKEVASIENELYNEVKEYFDMDTISLAEKDYTILKEYYFKKKYLQRILDSLV